MGLPELKNFFWGKKPSIRFFLDISSQTLYNTSISNRSSAMVLGDVLQVFFDKTLLDLSIQENVMIDVFSISESDFPKTISVKLPGVRYCGRKMILLKAIHNDSSRNSVRQGGMSEYGQHIQELVNSFKRGVDVFLPIPVVEQLSSAISTKDGNILDFQAVDCHHRIKALRELGVDRYVFDIYKFDNDTARILFQLEMNNHYPNKNNTEKDIIHSYSVLIKDQGQFLLPNGDIDFAALEDSLDRTTRYGSGKIINTIIPQIIQGSGVPTKNMNYVNDEGEKWIYSNMPGRVLGSKGGDLWIFKTGTWERTYQRMKRAIFNERSQNINRVHQIILNVQADLHEDISASRNKFVGDIRMAFEVDGFLTDGKIDVNTQNKYFKIAYAFPQVRDGSEDMNMPVIL